jgi:Tol biopolymer transport system component
MFCRVRLVVGSVALIVSLAGSAAGANSGRPIAFSDRTYYKDGGDSWEVYVINADGTGRRRLTHQGKRLFDSEFPSWSADGRRIAFQSSGGIFVMDANGLGIRQLAKRGLAPAWSPDGGRIAYLRGNAIWVLRLGGRSYRLARRAAYYAPAWSPDGRRIVFVRGKDLWLIASKGGKARKLLAGGTNPSWAPNPQIAFDDPKRGGIFVINADGAGRRRLGDGADPSWSPDGRQIAFEGGPGISVMDDDGRNPRAILKTYPEMCCLAWGP